MCTVTSLTLFHPRLYMSLRRLKPWIWTLLMVIKICEYDQWKSNVWKTHQTLVLSALRKCAKRKARQTLPWDILKRKCRAMEWRNTLIYFLLLCRPHPDQLSSLIYSFHNHLISLVYKRIHRNFSNLLFTSWKIVS